jgi:hypothetical protein
MVVIEATVVTKSNPPIPSSSAAVSLQELAFFGNKLWGFSSIEAWSTASRGKIWITQPRPEIDHVGSAWLIRNFIDPEAKFIFAQTSARQEGALRYDMIDSEFGHHSD